jgi:hypothetical protein
MFKHENPGKGTGVQAGTNPPHKNRAEWLHGTKANPLRELLAAKSLLPTATSGRTRKIFAQTTCQNQKTLYNAHPYRSNTVGA